MRNRFATLGAGVLVLCAGAIAGVFSQAVAENKPSIEIPRMRQDFGEVFERAKYEYSFVVRNRGTADLIIEDVKPGCGCTVAKFDKVIAPGAEGKIDLVLDGERVHGEFAKTAVVKTNDPEHPELTLTIAGTEIPFLKVAPEGTIYLHGRYDEAVEKTVTLTTNEKDFDLKITEVTSNIDDKITYSVTPGPKKGEYTVNVKKKPDVPPTSAYGNITLKTNSEKAPETILQVHVMVKGSISVTPQTLNYGMVNFGANGSTGQPVTKTVTILKTDGTFELKDAVVNNKNFTAKIQPVEAGKQYKVEVTFVPPAKSGGSQREVGELVISTSDPREPSVKVHLVARAM